MQANRKQLILKADKAWRELILTAFHSKCAKCEAIYGIACHHLHCRNTAPDIRHSFLNGLPLCTKCHSFSHSEPTKFLDWLEDAFPLHYKFYNIYIPNNRSHFDSEYEDTIVELQEMRERLLEQK